MIALIEFERDLIIPQKEAERLNLKYDYIQGRIGKCIYNNIIGIMSDNDYYIENVIKKEDKYYYDDKYVSEYRIYEQIKNQNTYVLVKNNNNLVDLTKFAPLCNYQYSIIKCVEEPEDIEKQKNIMDFLHDVENKVSSISQKVDEMQHFNSKCNVHVGGLITIYNEVTVLYDCCTDELQKELNNGWRIISACVQPDQRRPDYIIGRFNPNLDVNKIK